MKFKKLVSAAAAAALFLTMASPVSDHRINIVRPELTASAVTYEDATCAQYALRVAELVNQERASRGTAAVTLSEELCQAANVRAKEIERSFSHYRPDGSEPYTAIDAYGVSYTAAAENIAEGQTNADQVMNSWMNSDGHRTNLLNGKYNYIGVGVHYSNGRYYWVQFFAKSSNMTAADVNPKSGSTTRKTSISQCAFYMNAASFTYTGSAITPAITVMDGSKTLTKGTDYTVTYANNVNVGTATFTVTGKGNYSGSVTGEFKITAAAAKSISSCTVTLSGSSFTYTGSAIKPGVTVKDGSKTLKSGTDYTVSYSDNVNAGTGKVTVTGKGSYNGSVTKTFTIKSASNSMPGDLNRDKRVDTQDIALMQQYLSKWSVSIDTKAADVTGDRVINDLDLARLQQYVSHWNVQLVSA